MEAKTLAIIDFVSFRYYSFTTWLTLLQVKCPYKCIVLVVSNNNKNNSDNYYSRVWCNKKKKKNKWSNLYSLGSQTTRLRQSAKLTIITRKYLFVFTPSLPPHPNIQIRSFLVESHCGGGVALSAYYIDAHTDVLLYCIRSRASGGGGDHIRGPHAGIPRVV